VGMMLLRKKQETFKEEKCSTIEDQTHGDLKHPQGKRKNGTIKCPKIHPNTCYAKTRCNETQHLLCKSKDLSIKTPSEIPHHQ
jgi:hypothetical protein